MTKDKEAPEVEEAPDMVGLPMLIDGLAAIGEGRHEHCHGHDSATDPCAFARALLGDFEALVATLSSPAGH